MRSRKTCRPAVATKTVVSREADIQRVSVESPIFTKVKTIHLTNSNHEWKRQRPTRKYLSHLRESGKPIPIDCIGCHVGWRKDFSGFTFDFAHRFLLQPIRTHSILSTFLCFSVLMIYLFWTKQAFSMPLILVCTTYVSWLMDSCRIVLVLWKQLALKIHSRHLLSSYLELFLFRPTLSSSHSSMECQHWRASLCFSK